MTPMASGGYTQWNTCTGFMAARNANAWRSRNTCVFQNSAQLDALQERLTQLSAASGFEGRVVLIGDDAMGESDCRVEWADGGVEREAGRIWRAIEEALARYIAVDDRDPK